MSRRRCWGALLGCLLGLLVLGAPASGGPSAGAAVAVPVTLNLWTSGFGSIDATPAGGSPVHCDYTDILNQENPCPVTVDTGASVTLTATPEAGSTFVHWSRSECEETNPCTFTVEEDGDWVAAIFSPLGLEVGIAGDGTVEAAGLGPCVAASGSWASFGATSVCSGSFAAEEQVVLTAKPGPTSNGTISWKPGTSCEPEGGDFSSSKCTVTMTNIRTFASVAFGDPDPSTVIDPPGFPFQITVKVRVKRGGTGHGTVSGSGKDTNDNSWSIDCGGKCSEDVGYQSRLSLKADAAAGSKFVRWVGACGTADTCRFSAGSVTTIEARFDAAPPPPPPPPLTAALLKVSVRGTGARRAIVLLVAVDRPAVANARLLKRTKPLARRSFRLVSGRNSRRLQVPRAVKPGWYRLSLKVAATGQTKTFTRRVRLRR